MLSFTPAEISLYYSSRLPDLPQTQTRSWRGPCPVHNGSDDNFSVDVHTGMAYCHSQCARGWDIVALEMVLGHLTFPKAKESVYLLLGRDYKEFEESIEATYEYTDENGVLSYQVVRQFPKKFLQRRKVNGNWVWNLKGVTPLPFNLETVKTSPFCVLVEGEADVICLKQHGIPASCNSGGAGNWKPELNRHFQGKRLLLIPDNDEKGREHVLHVARELNGIASRIQILQIPGLPEKGDVRDWFTRGGSVEALRDLTLRNARDWTPEFAFTSAPSEEDKWVYSPTSIIVESGGMEKAWDLAGEDGAPTPFEKLNELLGGCLRKQEVYMLAGRTGSGKTSMLLQFAMSSLEVGFGVLFFSLEMSGLDVLRRMASIEAMVDLAQLRILQKKNKLGEITLADTQVLNSIQSRLYSQTERFAEFPLLVHQKPVVTPEYIVAETQRLAKSNKIDLVCVDHMQLMSSDGSEKKEYEKFTAISRAMKGQVARELNVPVLVASQVSRTNAQDHRDELEVSDLRGSGALEEDAAAVMLIYHDKEDAKRAIVDGRSCKGPVKSWLKVGKNRFGPRPAYLSMMHYKKYTRFEHTPMEDPDQERATA